MLDSEQLGFSLLRGDPRVSFDFLGTVVCPSELYFAKCKLTLHGVSCLQRITDMSTYVKVVLFWWSFSITSRGNVPS